MGSIGAIRFPHDEGNAVFHITSIKGLFIGLDHKNRHEHIKNFMDVCRLLSFKNIS